MTTQPAAPVEPELEGEVGLRRVLERAGRAPSVHNTQPWRWRVRDGEVELLPDLTRQLLVADPSGRELVVSCGTALHHLRVAAAAEGQRATVDYLVRDQAGGLSDEPLARVRLEPTPVTPRAEELLALLERRCTDRRRFTSWPVPDTRLESLADLALPERVSVTALTGARARWRAELLVAEATRSQQADPAYCAEQAAWVGRSTVDGIPVTSLGTTSSGRSGTDQRPVSRFVAPGVARMGELEQLEPTDGLLVIATEGDGPADWLAAGEVLSRLWFSATGEGLSLVPLSQVVELPWTRAELRHRVLATDRWPQLLVRIGWQQIGRSDLPRTPRRPVSDLLVEG